MDPFCAEEIGRIVPGVGIGAAALGIEHAEEESDEPVARTALDQVEIDVRDQGRHGEVQQRLGGEEALDHGSQECGSDPFAGDIAQGKAEPAALQLEIVEVVASDLPARQVLTVRSRHEAGS